MYVQRCLALSSFSPSAILVACGEPAKVIAGGLGRLSLAVLLAAGAGVTLADAAILGDWLGATAVESTSPTLLGPVTSAGRKAWNCKPEVAASARRVDEADLPH